MSGWWTHKEVEEIAKTVVRLMARNRALSQSQALSKAQRLVLPQERWHKQTALYDPSIRLLEAIYKAKRLAEADLIVERKAEQPPEPTKAPEPIQGLRDVEPAPKPTVEATPKPTSRVITLEIPPDDRLATSMDRLAQAVENLVGVLQSGTLTRTVVAQPSPFTNGQLALAVPTPVPSPPRKPRLVVAGLLPDQVRAVANRLGGQAQVEAWNERGSTAAKPDAYLVAGGFLSHSQIKQIQDTGAKVLVASKGRGVYGIARLGRLAIQDLSHA